MAEWSIAHAWKADLFTRTDARQSPPTHVRSISSRYNQVLRDAPVSDDVHRGFRGVCDTVLTQKPVSLGGCPPVLRCTSQTRRSILTKHGTVATALPTSCWHLIFPSASSRPFGAR